MLLALSKLGVIITLGVGHRRKGQCDMIERFSRFMSVQSSRPRSTVYRFWALSGGAFLFLFLVPFLLGIIARFVARPIQVSVPRAIELAVAIPIACFGLWFLAWAVFVFWNIGGGTPAPVAAPQKLVVSGPYRYCRNPIQLGAICYFFGLGCVLLSFVAGLVMFLMGLILGSVYHKLVEEPELLLRFGSDYDNYRKRTPFLIPRPWRRYLGS